jgi:hypothetical protein
MLRVDLAAITAVALLASVTSSASPSVSLTSSTSSTSPSASSAPSNATRMVSAWMTCENSTQAKFLLDTIAANGGTRVLSTAFIWLGDSLNNTGSFLPNPHPPPLASGLRAMGIGAETIINANISGLLAGAANPSLSIPSIVSHVVASNLTGVSFDTEYEGSREDERLFASFLAALKRALEPVGARVTVYSNSFDSLIANVTLLASSVDRVLCGETYNAKNFTEWTQLFEGLAEQAPVRKISTAMMATTSRGDWNCYDDGMSRRLQALEKRGVPELSIFTLNALNASTGKGDCAQDWFPYMRQFLAPSSGSPLR